MVRLPRELRLPLGARWSPDCRAWADSCGHAEVARARAPVPRHGVEHGGVRHGDQPALPGAPMITRASLIVAGLLALPATASAQEVTGPDAPPAPATVVACKPDRVSVCGPASPLPIGRAIASYTSTLRSDRTRRGLGLPSLRKLFGKAGAGAQNLADARLGGGTAKSAATARAAAALGSVGSVGPVKVQASVAPGLGAAVDQVTYEDRIRGPRGSQSRSLRFTATADACPIAAVKTDNVGKDMGHLLAAEHIVTVQRSGRLEVKTDFTIDMTSTQTIWGLVKGNSDLDVIEPSGLPTAYTRIRRVRTARDLQTGRRFREKPLELKYELHFISPLWMDGGGFAKFIKETGDDGDPADALVDDRLLNEDAFEAAARTFMGAVETKTREVFENAERQWKTPNRCVDVTSDAPTTLVPGSSVKVHVSAASKRGDPAANLRSYAHYAPYRSLGLTVDPFVVVAADENVAHDFTVTAPAKPWADDNPETFRVLLYSTGGIGEVNADFKAQALPFHYRVLDATFTTKSTGSQPGGLCAPLGGTSGMAEIAGALGGAAQEIDTNKLDAVTPTTVPWEGQIYARVPAAVSTGIKGCTLNSAVQVVPCEKSYPNVPMAGPMSVGFNIWVDDPRSGDAKIHWLVPNLEIGGAQQTCGVMIWRPVPYETFDQHVPLSKLLSATPETFTLAGSVHYDVDSNGKPASIDYDWTYTLTVQRM